MLDTGTATLFVGLGSAIIGSLGTKFFDVKLSRKKMQVDYASQIRSEQRAELLSLRFDYQALERQADKWREKYFEVVEENIELKKELGIDDEE
jgi:hypothetical protein